MFSRLGLGRAWRRAVPGPDSAAFATAALRRCSAACRPHSAVAATACPAADPGGAGWLGLQQLCQGGRGCGGLGRWFVSAAGRTARRGGAGHGCPSGVLGAELAVRRSWRRGSRRLPARSCLRWLGPSSPPIGRVRGGGASLRRLPGTFGRRRGLPARSRASVARFGRGPVALPSRLRRLGPVGPSRLCLAGGVGRWFASGVARRLSGRCGFPLACSVRGAVCPAAAALRPRGACSGTGSWLWWWVCCGVGRCRWGWESSGAAR